jgi:hypothetical protein
MGIRWVPTRVTAELQHFLERALRGLRPHATRENTTSAKNSLKAKFPALSGANARFTITKSQAADGRVWTELGALRHSKGGAKLRVYAKYQRLSVTLARDSSIAFDFSNTVSGCESSGEQHARC